MFCLDARLALCLLLAWMLLLGGLLPLGVCCAAIRATDDMGGDLITTLLSQSRIEDAKWICRQQISAAAEGQLQHARWTARLSEVFAEENAVKLFGGRPSELSNRIGPAIDSSCQPIDNLLASYSESSNADFLAATKMQIRQRILRAAIIVASISPADQTLNDDLVARISRLQLDAESLHKNAAAQWSAQRGTVGGAAPDKVAAAQYDRLIQELAVDRIAIAVLLSELFPKGGDDFRSAASEAVTVAEQAILALPDGSQAKMTATALLAEATLRSGDLFKAGQLIDNALNQPSLNSSPVWLALQVHHQLASGNVAAARRTCDSYFGSSNGGSGAFNMEMAFAKLDVLVSDSKSDSEVADWLDEIGKYGGAFARRRAESIAIHVLREQRTSGDSTMRPINPALIAAQGEDWLRRNDPGQAATLLREAALAEPQAETAFQYAAKSAAASVATKDHPAAIEVLRQAARKHVAESSAADLMMQAALLASKPFAASDDPQARLVLLEETLNEIADCWPTSETASKANSWHCTILVKTGRQEEAAHSALQLLMLGKRLDQIAPTMTLWFDYVSKLDADQATTALASLSAALDELTRETPSLAGPLARDATCLLDQPLPPTISAAEIQPDESAEFLEQLSRFRTTGSGAFDVTNVGAELLNRARWRLQRDATLDPSRQRAIGNLLSTWPNQDPWQQATASLWANQDAASIEAIRKLALAGQDQPVSLRRAMEAVATVRSSDAIRAAVELGDRLAATMKIGSQDWYAIKLRSTQWLREVGDAAAAKKRASYILLLHSPEDPQLKQQFERLAE